MDTGDAAVISVDDYGAITEVVFDGRVVSAGEGERFGYDTTGALPNMDDCATLGCIEHGLLPEAWGPGCRISARWHGGLGSVRVYVEGKAVFSIESVPKADALVAALAAAPRREVGR